MVCRCDSSAYGSASAAAAAAVPGGAASGVTPADSSWRISGSSLYRGWIFSVLLIGLVVCETVRVEDGLAGRGGGVSAGDGAGGLCRTGVRMMVPGRALYVGGNKSAPH